MLPISNATFSLTQMKRLKELESYYLALLIVRHAVHALSTCNRCAGRVGELRKEKGGAGGTS